MQNKSVQTTPPEPAKAAAAAQHNLILENRHLATATGIKRIVLTSPAFTKLRDGSGDTVPQVGKVSTVTITNGGYEDE